VSIVPHKPPVFVDAHLHCSRREALEDVAAAGIGAVRTAGSVPVDGDACLHSDQPVVVSSCWALFKKGGYGGRFGRAVDSVSEIAAEVLRLKQAGADIVKVMASGMVSLKVPGTVTAGGFNANELKLLVEEAGSRGLPVMAHANGEQAIMGAVEAGVRSIEHGFFMTPRALEFMARKKTFWTPTVGALVRTSASATGTETREFVTSLMRQHLQMVSRAHVTGVPLVVGTDCVLPDPAYGAAYAAELAYLREAGIAEDAVTTIATENGMRLLGIDE
jgi:imidazolonepropionase-like amidohydrolase